jgi:signal transduction histidine kinase
VQHKNFLLESANLELFEANEMKRAFIKVASHELRTPLTMVVGLAEMARNAAVDPAMRAWLDKICNASQRLRHRVDQMTTLLQAERFQRQQQRETISAESLCRRAADEVASFIAQRKQTLAVETVDVPLSVDAEQILDSVVQLLVNAIKFTPDGGAIKLAATATDKDVEIRVTDSGQGIEPACLPRVFEPFFTRFDVSHHRSGTCEFDRRGLGLGLPMVKAFVEMNGGQVAAESSSNSGTTFRITLPR